VERFLRKENMDNEIKTNLIFSIIGMFAVIAIWIGQAYLFGDWKCLFAQCSFIK
jgi:hypothetical protein